MLRNSIGLHIGLLILAIVVLTGCRKSNSFIVEGTFSVADSTPVKIYQLKENKSELVDSVFASEGDFRIKASTENTQIYLLKFFNDQSIMLVIRPGDRIKISINNNRPEISYYVENSPDSKRIKELIDKQNIVLKQIDQLSRDWFSNPGDTSTRFELDKRYQNLLLSHRDYTRKFIYEQPQSLANILALYQNFGRKSQPLFDRYDDLELFNFVDSNLVILYPDNEAVKALNREVTETKEQIAQKKYLEKAVVEGRSLPPLKYVAINGDTIIADGGQRKPVLLFFWASWNPYSTNELLQLNKFRTSKDSSRIQIITVSLDSSKEKLEEFISSNSIKLTVLCDYQYWESDLAARFAVKQIPSSILANKEGFVIAKNIFSYELYNSLNQIIR